MYLSFKLLIHCSVGLHSDATLKAFNNFPVCLLDGTKALLIAKHIKMLLQVALSLLKPAVRQFFSLWFACCVQDLSVVFQKVHKINRIPSLAEQTNTWCLILPVSVLDQVWCITNAFWIAAIVFPGSGQYFKTELASTFCTVLSWHLMPVLLSAWYLGCTFNIYQISGPVVSNQKINALW